MPTHTLTALFSDAATAERAAERLRAIGVSEDSLDLHPESAGDLPTGRVGILDLVDPLLPREDGGERADARTVLVASRVDGDLSSEARSILHEEAIEVDDEPDAA
jgi:hypothetical protein